MQSEHRSQFISSGGAGVGQDSIHGFHPAGRFSIGLARYVFEAVRESGSAGPHRLRNLGKCCSFSGGQAVPPRLPCPLAGDSFSSSYGRGSIAPKPSHARPANPRLSVDTFTFSPSLMKRGTRISRPVSSLAGLVTLPLDESPRTPGSVEATSSSTNVGSSKPMGLPLYLSNSTSVPPIRKSIAFPITSSARVRVS